METVRACMIGLKAPQHYDKVFKDECIYTFDTPFSEGGLAVNLRTWQGVALDMIDLDLQRSGGKGLYLLQKFRREEKQKPADEQEPTKMAIGVEGGFMDDKWEIIKEYSLLAISASGERSTLPYPSQDLPILVSDVCEAIEKHQVPAFEATKKFYKRIASLEEEAYSQAAVQKFSVLLKSKVGGPKLLLCPVPDQRIKQRDRDEFVGLVMLAPSAKQVADAAEKAIAVALEEEQKKDEEEKEQLRLAGKKPEDLKKGTLARPAVQMVGSDAGIDDGVGNIVTFMDNGAFKSSLA